eukprot:gene2792-biopygen23098
MVAASRPHHICVPHLDVAPWWLCPSQCPSRFSQVQRAQCHEARVRLELAEPLPSGDVRRHLRRVPRVVLVAQLDLADFVDNLIHRVVVVRATGLDAYHIHPRPRPFLPDRKLHKGGGKGWCSERLKVFAGNLKPFLGGLARKTLAENNNGDCWWIGDFTPPMFFGSG